MRTHGLVLVSLVFLLVAAPGCENGTTTDPTLGSLESPVIYGADDRQQYYEIGDASRQTLADSTVAVLDTADLSVSGGGFALDVSLSFASAHRLCSTEPYRAEPTTAFCSGFQVGPDLVATAGHCIDAVSCGATAFVFGFRMDAPGVVRSWVPTDDVYFCAEVVARTQTSVDDFAVVRVDRAIAGHQPLPIRRSGTVANGTPLVVAGHPSGIPFKVAGGAVVKDASPAYYFSANLDTYGGNSGSPVMNAATGVIEGILVRGSTDFVYDRKKRCYVSNQCSDSSGCPGFEDASKIARIAAYVPDAPSCAVDADCSDGAPCNGAEACVAGHCQAAAAIDCGDGDACTDDACVALDAVNWTCEHAAIVCDDGDACTDDSCDASVGCVFAAIDCGDGDACTIDACVALDAVHWTCTNTAVGCDDGDACTIDSCDGGAGCVFTAVVCGAGEVCEGGSCVLLPVCGGYRDACSSNADCCSGNCNRKKRTCR